MRKAAEDSRFGFGNKCDGSVRQCRRSAWAIVSVSLSILLSSLSGCITKSKAKAQGIMCMNNMRQLTLAWIQYAHDNNDRIPYASAKGSPGPPDPATGPYVWVTGLIDSNPANPSNWDLAWI